MHEDSNSVVWSPPGSRWQREVVSFHVDNAKGPGDPMRWDMQKMIGPQSTLIEDKRSLLCGRVKARYVVLKSSRKNQMMQTVFARVDDYFYDAAYIRPLGSPADRRATAALLTMCPQNA